MKTNKSIKGLLLLLACSSLVELVPAPTYAAKKSIEFRVKYFDLSEEGPSLSSADKEDRAKLQEAMVKNKCFEKQVRAFKESKKDESVTALLEKAKPFDLRVDLEVTFGPEKSEKGVPNPVMSELRVWKETTDRGEVLLNSVQWTSEKTPCRVASTRVRRVMAPVVAEQIHQKKAAEEEARLEKARAKRANLKKAADLLNSLKN